MCPDNCWEVSRRSFLIASTGMLLSKLTWAESRNGAALCWILDDHGDTALEDVLGTRDRISSRTGHAIWVGKGRDRELRLDGYSVWIDHTSSHLALRGGALTISAWLALESYPVNEAAVVQQEMQPNPGFSFAIDKWGHLLFRRALDERGDVCRSDGPVPRSKWNHLAVTVAHSGEVTLYQNGVASGHQPASGKYMQLGKTTEVLIAKSNDSPIVAHVFPTGVLNGLIKDVQIFDAQLSPASIHRILEHSKPDGLPDLQINRAWCSSDKQRPVYHALPPRAWTNEPHGLIHWGGQYHLFYQKNANGPYWGNINWGHMTSPDLYHWTEMPVALSPEPGPDAEGCWSGSVIDHDGKLALIYTGGDGHKASICIALSADGIHFTKYEGNPIIPAPPPGLGYPEFRDPFVWREGDVYYMIVGSAVKDVGGTALLYRSDDLVHWRYLKPLMVGNKNTSGVFWEMPIFVKIGDKHVLIVCEVPGRSSYWIGTWKNERFEPASPEPRRLELFNHLLSPTPYTTADGRVITMGIIPDQRSPRETWRAGWAHLYSLPRVLSVGPQGDLQQTPLDDIDQWSDSVFLASDLALEDGTITTPPQIAGARMKIDVAIRRGESQSVSLFLRRSPDGREQTELRYEWPTGSMVLDRSRSSLDPLVKRDIQETTYWPATAGVIHIVAFLDESVLEVFVDGRAAFATRIYPTLEESDDMGFGCVGPGARIKGFSVARIKLRSRYSLVSRSHFPSHEASS